MKRTVNNYILVITTGLCFLSSLAAFVYANIVINNKLSAANATKASVSYNYSDVHIFSRNIFMFLLVMGIITAIMMFLLARRIFQADGIDEYKYKKREAELTDKNVQLENMVRKLKEKEKMLEHDNLKMEFFANISHDFKTPINILIGAMQLLELYASNGTIIDPQLKFDKYIKTMKQNALRLLRLINNIIDLTKIDSSYFHIEIHNYDIAQVVEGIIESISLYAKTKSINIIFKKEIAEQVMAIDADKIERILLNLLSNALKFTDEGGRIEIELGTRESSVYISVKDDGIGIQDDKLDIIFQRFRQADKSFARNREGSGIGLSIVKALVEMHDGTITVNSKYGMGSEFIVEVPIVIIKNEGLTKLHSDYEDSRLERIKVEFSDI